MFTNSDNIEFLDGVVKKKKLRIPHLEFHGLYGTGYFDLKVKMGLRKRTLKRNVLRQVLEKPTNQYSATF